MGIRSLSPLGFIAVATIASADPVWIANGPDGGEVAMFAASQTWLYAATVDGVFRSNDSATNWQRSGSGIARGTSILSVAVSPGNANLVLAGSAGFIHRSVDAGVTWTSIAVTGAPTRIVFSSRSSLPNEVFFLRTSTFAAQAEALRKSVDGGLTWVTVNGPGGTPLLAKGFAADAFSNRYYALDGGQKLLTTTTAGVSWNEAGQVAFPSNNGRQPLLVDPNNPDVVIWSADNLDATYLQRHRVSSGITSYAMTAYKAHELAGEWDGQQRLWFSAISEFVTPSQRLYESLDHGQTWADVNSDRPVRMLAADRWVSGRLYGSTASGPEVSDDAGRHWETRARGIPLAPVTALSIDPVDPSIIVATTANGTSRSIDAGATWSPSVQNPQTSIAPIGHGSADYALALHPYNASRRMALRAGPTGPAAYLSNDGGASWQLRGNVPVASTSSPSQLQFDPCDTETLYAATGNWVYRSADLGLSWQQEPTLLRSNRHTDLDVACNNGLLIVAAASLESSVQIRRSSPNDRILRAGFDE